MTSLTPTIEHNPGYNDLDHVRQASMADEGGRSAAILERQEQRRRGNVFLGAWLDSRRFGVFGAICLVAGGLIGVAVYRQTKRRSW